MENYQENQNPSEVDNIQPVEDSGEKNNPIALVGAIIALCVSIILFVSSLWFTGHFILGWW